MRANVKMSPTVARLKPKLPLYKGGHINGNGHRHGAYWQRHHGVACKHFLTDLARHDDYSLRIIVRLNMTSSL